ncbi:hypothetical protein M0804_001575 [Polistes exclamans]|nr:hypothetical protein M0804_001575 [Polistes exclamans]
MDRMALRAHNAYVLSNVNQKDRFDAPRSDFSLHIYPVELDDDGIYQCQASPTNNGQPALRSRFARLSVLVPPEPPKILQGDFLVTTEDRELVIECVSVAGKPPAESECCTLSQARFTYGVYMTHQRLATKYLHLTLPYFTLPYLTLPYFTLPYLTLPYLTLPYLALPYSTLLYFTLPYFSSPAVLRKAQ